MAELIPVNLSGDGQKKMENYLQERCTEIKREFDNLFRSKLSAWRRIYNAKPLEEVREYPFHNASNLVVPVVAIHVDTLLARIMSAVFRTRPLWSLRVIGSPNDKTMIDARAALEDALVEFSFSPDELDLYRVEREFFSDVVKYGHSTIKSLWEVFQFSKPIPSGDGSGQIETTPVTYYEGPRPEKIPYEDFMAPPTAKTINKSDFNIHVLHLKKHQLEEKAFLRFYDPASVMELLRSPDRNSPSEIEQQKLSDAEIQIAPFQPEWDIYECWFHYWINNKKFKLVATYHPKTKKILRLVYDPFDLSVFVDSSLFPADDLIFGSGFAEALGSFQEEISETHNHRKDAEIVANCSMLRVSPDSKLNAGYRIFPGVMLPAEQGEVEPLQFGQPSSITIDDERLTLDLAQQRSGVSQAQQGLGAGTMSKRGVYTAMGTMSLLQEGNNRTSLNVADLRYAHMKLGRLLIKQYGEDAVKSKFTCFGDEKATLIMAALKAFDNKQLALDVGGASASLNREVEKQNDLMLSNIMRMHYQAIAQMVGAISQPTTPPEVKDYLTQAIHASNILMKDVLRVFDKNEPERMVPEPHEQLQQPSPGGAGGSPQMVQPGGGQGVSQLPGGGAQPQIGPPGQVQ